MTYTELKRKQQDDINNFEGLFFAFNNEQYKEGIAKVGASIDNKIVNIGAGGYILKSQYQNLLDTIKRHKQELKDLKKEEQKLIEAIVYEMNNHEYCITYDINDALDALNMKKEEIDNKILEKAKKTYWENYEQIHLQSSAKE